MHRGVVGVGVAVRRVGVEILAQVRATVKELERCVLVPILKVLPELGRTTPHLDCRPTGSKT